METMTIEVKIQITNDAIESMLVTALEGGSNYWYDLKSKTLNDAKNWLLKEIEEGRLKRNESVHYTWMDAMFQGYPKAIPVYDSEEIYGIEDEDELEDVEPIGHLSMENIKKGLEKASKEYPHQFSQYFPEYTNGDADDADVLFQLICLDDVVYG
jgi:hypothetical protein